MRVRNKSIPFRVIEKELEAIDKKATKARLSRTDYLIAAATGKEITFAEDQKQSQSSHKTGQKGAPKWCAHFQCWYIFLSKGGEYI